MTAKSIGLYNVTNTITHAGDLRKMMKKHIVVIVAVVVVAVVVVVVKVTYTCTNPKIYYDTLEWYC